MAGLGLALRRWVSADGGPANDSPAADPYIDHPAPQGAWIEQDHIPFLLAPDPAGVGPRAGVQEFMVEAVGTPVQHSPLTNWNPGSPYPGPPATVWAYVDHDSARWWGRTGQGRLVWSERTEFSADLPPLLPADLIQHLDHFQGFWGGYRSMPRNRPTAFGDQVPQNFGGGGSGP